jgi:hypothetical protein
MNENPDPNSPIFSPHLPPVPAPIKPATTWSKRMYDEMPPEPAPLVLPKLGPIGAAKLKLEAKDKRRMSTIPLDSAVKSLPPVPRTVAPPPVKTMKNNAGTAQFRSWLKNLQVEDDA